MCVIRMSIYTWSDHIIHIHILTLCTAGSTGDSSYVLLDDMGNFNARPHFPTHVQPPDSNFCGNLGRHHTWGGD